MWELLGAEPPPLLWPDAAAVSERRDAGGRQGPPAARRTWPPVGVSGAGVVRAPAVPSWSQEVSPFPGKAPLSPGHPTLRCVSLEPLTGSSPPARRTSGKVRMSPALFSGPTVTRSPAGGHADPGSHLGAVATSRAMVPPGCQFPHSRNERPKGTWAVGVSSGPGAGPEQRKGSGPFLPCEWTRSQAGIIQKVADSWRPGWGGGLRGVC